MYYRYLEEPDFAEMANLERRLLPDRPESFYRCNPQALRHFARSGHSFVAAEDGLHGFVLAQPVWQGDRATVLVTRIAADSDETCVGLLRALVKSAYDANAYEVALLAGDDRSRLLQSAEAAGFESTELKLLARVLGSRGARGEKSGVLE